MSTCTIRLLLVDDHCLFRAGMRQLLSLFDDFAVVGEAGSGEEALPLIEAAAPDVILMDIDMPGRGGVLSTRLIRAVHPTCRILLLSGYQRYAAAGIQAGACGYILKHAEEEEIAEAIRVVYHGGVYLQPQIQAAVAEGLQQGRVAQFSEREVMVLRLIAQGLGNREIGAALKLSEHRVKQHISALFERLGANDRAHAVALAMRLGVL